MRLACAMGARPNFVKMAMVIAELRRRSLDRRHALMKLGQHYDRLISENVSRSWCTGAATIFGSGSGSASHSLQTRARDEAPRARVRGASLSPNLARRCQLDSSSRPSESSPCSLRHTKPWGEINAHWAQRRHYCQGNRRYAPSFVAIACSQPSY